MGDFVDWPFLSFEIVVSVVDFVSFDCGNNHFFCGGMCEGPFDGGSVDVAAVCMYHVPR